MKNTWKEDFERLLLDGTKYSGSKKPGERKISASSLNVDDYQLILQFKHGNQEQDEFGANTAGSIYQHGIDRIIELFDKNDRYIVAKRMSTTLPNGWVVSGEYDVFDTLTKTVIDAKLLAGGSYTKVILNNKDHDYNLQVGTYKWLTEVTNQEHAAEHTGLHLVNKGGSAIKGNVHKNMDTDTYPSPIIKQKFIEKTNRLEAYIKNDVLPEPCDVFKYGKSNGIPNRCNHYCDYKNVCPDWKKRSHSNTHNFVGSLKVEKEKPSTDPLDKPANSNFRF